MPRRDQGAHRGLNQDKDMQLSLIWAMAENRVIGRDNSLPWQLPNDMRHFMKTTMGRPVIGPQNPSHEGAVAGRTNIVLTQNSQWRREGVQFVAALDEAIALAESQCVIDGVDEVMIIGGAQIYNSPCRLQTDCI